MAKAKIELMKGASLSAHGRILKANHPQIITDVAEIRYYESVSYVRVTHIKEPELKPEPELEPEPKSELESKPKPELELEPKPELELESKKEKPEIIIETKKIKKPAYKKEALKTKAKPVLIEIARAMGLYMDTTDKKKEIISSILKAQKEG